MKGKIFTAQEVQAIIAGNKTQFREVIKFDKELFAEPTFSYGKNGHSGEGYYVSEYDYAEEGSDFVKCPYQVGQKIFCKESFDIWDEKVLFKANATKQIRYLQCKWKPAQHMKQEHSRLTLQITEIIVERLAEISEKDIIAESVMRSTDALNPICEFKKVWNATHKKPEEKWEANPFVFVYQFKIIK
jgi:hypothetical protein